VDGTNSFNLDDVRDVISAQDHALLRFATLSQRLFLDFRGSEEIEPAVHVLPPVNSLRERIATIRRARPALPIPGELRVIGWPLRVGSLERLGVLDVIRGRFAADGASEALRQLADAIDQLERAERDELRRAITGDGYRTLWPSRTS
jgi:hypothetical protein